MNVDPEGKKSLKSRIRAAVKKAPKWVRTTLKKMFPNKKSWVTKQITMKSVQWGGIGGVTGQVIVSVSYLGKPKALKEYGPIGFGGGFLVGSHMGAISSVLPTTARYSIGVYLFG